MNSEERRVDGNAAAGLLQTIFPLDMTMVKAECAGCGATEPAGVHVVYADAPGMIMRCAHCESVLVKLVHGGGRYWLDMRGVACLQFVEP